MMKRLLALCLTPLLLISISLSLSAWHDEVLQAENVGDIIIHYNNGNRITVLYDGVFYTLSEAYNNGYLTEANLAEISSLHEIYNPYLYT